MRWLDEVLAAYSLWLPGKAKLTEAQGEMCAHVAIHAKAGVLADALPALCSVHHHLLKQVGQCFDYQHG